MYTHTCTRALTHRTLCDFGVETHTGDVQPTGLEGVLLLAGSHVSGSDLSALIGCCGFGRSVPGYMVTGLQSESLIVSVSVQLTGLRLFTCSVL